MNQHIIKINNLTFAYQEQSILQGIELSIKVNEFVGIIGPNGAGKSTLIKLICGLIPVPENNITILGKTVDRHAPKELSRIIGYVPQNVNINFSLTVREVIAMGRYPYQHGFWNEDADGESHIDSALQWMDLEKLRDRSFNELSGGEQQRAILAGVLAQEADILILDEPTSALDLHYQQEIYRILRKLVQEKNKTILIVTHDVNLAAQFCGRIVILNDGKIVANGSPQEVLKFPMIQKVYGVKVYIDINPLSGSLYILPYDIA